MGATLLLLDCFSALHEIAPTPGTRKVFVSTLCVCPLLSHFSLLSFLPVPSSLSPPLSPSFSASLHPHSFSLPLTHVTMILTMETPFFWSVLGLCLLFLMRWSSTPALKGVPTVKYHRLLPDFLNRIFYYPNAVSMINEGYYKNALGDYTHIILNTELVSLTIRKRLTPALCRVVPRMIDEMVGVFNDVLPGEGEWVKINSNTLFNRLIAISASRLMVGDILRQNEEWLNAAITYAHSLGITLVLLRPVPKYLRPLVAPFLPPIWHMSRSVRLARRLFVPIIEERRRAAKENPGYTRPDDFLQWMLDLGEELDENLPASEISTHMLLLVGLAVTHTSTMALCHGIFDLITKPEYLEPLREEIQRTLPDGWHKGTQAAFGDQVRLDSFMRESQRFAPPGDLSFHRIVMQPLTLHDGIVLPKGIHVCFPAGAISRDPGFVANPSTFDGFRWCKDPKDRYLLCPELANSVETKSENDEDAGNAPASWVSVTTTNMGFGFGRQTCPGRFFAANTAKIIMSRLILDYDFKLAGKKSGERPPNVYIGEHILPNLHADLLFRKKTHGF
ncbi:unnamed protein product [Penicillium olsonii]|uniref:Uncharacterized protein n=1 Tax=Penicillium olsonii TaxID=99116 RepID=A0A9W4HX97_PENOL|nr:unnamed protein product [Penicillium olsonii]